MEGHSRHDFCSQNTLRHCSTRVHVLVLAGARAGDDSSGRAHHRRQRLAGWGYFRRDSRGQLGLRQPYRILDRRGWDGTVGQRHSASDAIPQERAGASRPANPSAVRETMDRGSHCSPGRRCWLDRNGRLHAGNWIQSDYACHLRSDGRQRPIRHHPMRRLQHTLGSKEKGGRCDARHWGSALPCRPASSLTVAGARPGAKALRMFPFATRLKPCRDTVCRTSGFTLRPNAPSLPQILLRRFPLVVPIQHMHHAYLLQRLRRELAYRDVDNGPVHAGGYGAENGARRFGRHIDYVAL